MRKTVGSNRFQGDHGHSTSSTQFTRGKAPPELSQKKRKVESFWIVTTYDDIMYKGFFCKNMFCEFPIFRNQILFLARSRVSAKRFH